MYFQKYVHCGVHIVKERFRKKNCQALFVSGQQNVMRQPSPGKLSWIFFEEKFSLKTFKEFAKDVTHLCKIVKV